MERGNGEGHGGGEGKRRGVGGEGEVVEKERRTGREEVMCKLAMAYDDNY